MEDEVAQTQLQRQDQNLKCSEVLSRSVNFLNLPPPQPEHIPLSMDTSGSQTSSLVSLAIAGSGPMAGARTEGEIQPRGRNKPTLHVEVCQHTHSSMCLSKLKGLVSELLMERGTAFSELYMQDFEDQILKEHVKSITITDTPNDLKVRGKWLLLHVHNVPCDCSYSSWIYECSLCSSMSIDCTRRAPPR